MQSHARHPQLRLCENRFTAREPDQPLLHAYFKKLYRSIMKDPAGLASRNLIHGLRERAPMISPSRGDLHPVPGTPRG
ncbi:hypothetical protein TVNIR_0003 [Thioalkalivibrio nitratireducens DSM 14787]|uniref:Uncharacterized protein n=1 Tax=Thioalkalivibrio nitratireducens (strain DSM 14787 / UNIQEM 213 / ALEN2) TaxID=1255043 RepID=L0DRT1_THIND|nr:hypothetical protein TVNIR_0003 [Thioalkalivibrio nitratireducens DSM 14787]